MNIETLKNADMSSRPHQKTDSFEEKESYDSSAEGAVLSAGIKRLIDERDRCRSRAETLEREVVHLRAVNDELRNQSEHVCHVRDQYMRYASELLFHLRQVDSAIHDVVEKTLNDDRLASLAQSLSPDRPTPTPSPAVETSGDSYQRDIGTPTYDDTLRGSQYSSDNGTRTSRDTRNSF